MPVSRSVRKSKSGKSESIYFGLEPRQLEFVNSQHKYTFYLGGVGAGKALSLNTPLATPKGWTTMGEVAVGDVLFDEKGEHCHVTYVTPVMEDHQCYKVRFSDSTSIVADAEHVWQTWDYRARNKGSRPKLVTTEQIKATLRYRHMLNHAVPVARSLKLPEKELLIEPYLLGVWLGDGTGVCNNVTTADEEIISAIQKSGYTADYVCDAGAAKTYKVGKSAHKYDKEGLTPKLRALGVLGNKHIPQAYLRASKGQRLALLQGLMDTDGYIDQHGKCEFYSTSQRLADGVYELCCSLSLKATRRSKQATLYGKDCGVVHILAFTPYVPVFRLSRKLSRQHVPGKQSTRQRLRYITSVEPAESVPVRCIQVDSPRHLYLAGKAMVPTHNTYAGAVKAIMFMVRNPGSLGLIAAPTYPMLRDVTQRTFFQLLPDYLIASFNKSNNHVILTNRAEVLFRSTDDPDRLRGLNLAWYWMDEAPLCGYYSWQVLKSRLRFPGVEQIGWATGTPKGLDKFYEDFEKKPLPNHFKVHASTMENQANLPEGYIENLGYTGDFYKQEVLGQWVMFQGLVYELITDPFDQESHLKAPADDHNFTKIVGGIDWGYQNPCVILPFGIDSDGRAWQLDEWYQRNQLLENDVIPQVVKLTRQYKVEAWYCDPSEPEHIAKLNMALDSAMLECKAYPADNTITAGIQTVQYLLALRSDHTRGLYVSPRCVNTIAEYTSYQYRSEERNLRNPDEKPVKQFDHAMDATRYCLHSVLGQSRGKVTILGSRVSPGTSAKGLIEEAEREREDDIIRYNEEYARRRMQNARIAGQLERWGVVLPDWQR